MEGYSSENSRYKKQIKHFRDLDANIFKELDNEYEEIILMLNAMEKNADKFCF